MKRSITKWAQGISTGILATALSLMCACNNSVQTGETKSIDKSGVKIEEGENCVIPLPQGVKLEMVWVKPGTFTMGSPEDELGRQKQEIQHEVTLTHGYWIGKYEVTQGQYEAVMGANPSEFKGADLPVESVTWDETKEFCAKLTAIEKAAGRLPEGYEYTLPTEAQWEYACRAGTTTALNNEKDLTGKKECSEMDKVGWYWYNSDKKTHPVGQKLPNAWGLYDMHGNVFEWCLDYCVYENEIIITDTYNNDIKNPLCMTGLNHIMRGGGWNCHASRCRSALRSYSYPDTHNNNVGFRVSISLVPSGFKSF